MPLVTVILCTRNRAAMLREALSTLSSLETDGRFDYEVLVVDNGSTDDTQAVVREFAASPRVVRGVIEPQPGVVPARNRGVAEARGEWLAFFDDDQFADPRWLAELWRAAEAHACRCVGGAVTLRMPDGINRDLAPVSRMLLGETVGMAEPRPYNDRVTPGCGNLMVHRGVFDEVGLFDPRMADRGEDTELWLRMRAAGIAGWYTPTAIIHHRIPADRLSDEFLLKLSRKMARGMARNERHRWEWRYPLVWLARAAQAALVLAPRYVAARLKGDRERMLGTWCRLQMAFDYLREGLRAAPRLRF